MPLKVFDFAQCRRQAVGTLHYRRSAREGMREDRRRLGSTNSAVQLSVPRTAYLLRTVVPPPLRMVPDTAYVLGNNSTTQRPSQYHFAPKLAPL
eukprot:3077798-Rhodomonas_salina.1